ncbi:ECF transporter S component [Massilicoli timonensis]|uniref:ECF transporter S component n=1 Tax=Massilicoli timonensis TaxID=2015901 RepID=UPI0015B6D36B|nr:ECF transporter S component [Massilicoli timonensis]
MKQKQTTTMAFYALFVAIELVLMFTPLGFIPLSAIKITTMHIPVIIAGIVLGVKGGSLIGAVFGICSVINATINPVPTSFVFTPFYSIGAVSGNFYSLLIAIVPRIMIGVVSALLYRFLKNLRTNDSIATVICGFAGSMTNTVLVMGGIYLFFGPDYAAALDMSYDLLLGAIMGIVTYNGVIEAIAAAVMVCVICKALTPMTRKYFHTNA